jgi:hypothetical protein
MAPGSIDATLFRPLFRPPAHRETATDARLPATAVRGSSTDAAIRNLRCRSFFKSFDPAPMWSVSGDKVEPPQLTTRIMRIDANRQPPGPDGLPPARRSTPTPSSSPPAENLEASKQLTRALETLPLLRPERVARARERVLDPAYPSDVALGQVAGLLAEKLQP